MVATIPELLNYAGWVFSVQPEAIKEPPRGPHRKRARAGMFLALYQRGMSYHRIGELAGGLDHSTIIHSVRVAQALAAEDERFATRVGLVAKFKREDANVLPRTLVGSRKRSGIGGESAAECVVPEGDGRCDGGS